MKDKLGNTIHVGCKVARAVALGRSPSLNICTVTRIEDGKIFLDHSKTAIIYPDRLIVIESDPLVKLMDTYHLNKSSQLIDTCESFINTHQITCPESIYQVDMIAEDAYQLIEKICSIVGYAKKD